jgi:hypothetical protein
VRVPRRSLSLETVGDARREVLGWKCFRTRK